MTKAAHGNVEEGDGTGQSIVCCFLTMKVLLFLAIVSGVYAVHTYTAALYGQHCVWITAASPPCGFLLTVLMATHYAIQNAWKMASLTALSIFTLDKLVAKKQKNSL
jgi:hypothetical protein